LLQTRSSSSEETVRVPPLGGSLPGAFRLRGSQNLKALQDFRLKAGLRQSPHPSPGTHPRRTRNPESPQRAQDEQDPSPAEIGI